MIDCEKIFLLTFSNCGIGKELFGLITSSEGKLEFAFITISYGRTGASSVGSDKQRCSCNTVRRYLQLFEFNIGFYFVVIGGAAVC